MQRGRWMIGSALLAMAVAMPVMAEELSPYQVGFLDRHKSGLPMEVDSVTTLTAFSFSGTTLIYHYEAKGKFREDLDLEAYRQTRLDSYCETLADLYAPHELTAIEHDFGFTDGKRVSLGVTMDECAKKSREAMEKFSEFIREKSGAGQ